jgi:XRE family aerobic/anaerobic benzoate catabolism transcriptional regulator
MAYQGDMQTDGTAAAVDRYIASIGEISERYLAQLESGKANISIALLWQIAQAMGVAPNEFLPESAQSTIRLTPLRQFLEQLTPEQEQAAHALLLKHFVNPEGPVRGVALIGLRGAGKSTLGERLAASVDVPFIRISDVVEQLGGMSISELFSLGGQSAYRRLERDALQHVLDNYPTSVLEAGGSLVSEKETFNLLLGSFFTVWLRATPEDHMQRVMVQGDLRPVHASPEAMEDLRRILAEREADYRAANHTIETSGRSLDACLEELMGLTRCYLCDWGADHPRSQACGQRLPKGGLVTQRERSE